MEPPAAYMYRSQPEIRRVETEASTGPGWRSLLGYVILVALWRAEMFQTRPFGGVLLAAWTGGVVEA